MGGGDAKLLTASALWSGLNPAIVEFLGYVGVIGGIITWRSLSSGPKPTRSPGIGLPVPNSILMAKKIPYGIAIAIGGFLAFPSSLLFMTALQGLK